MRKLKLFLFGGTKVTTRIDGVHIVEDVDGIVKRFNTVKRSKYYWSGITFFIIVVLILWKLL